MTQAATPPRFIDTHAHLDDEAFAGDAAAVVARAVAAGVGRIVNIGYRPAGWRTTLELARHHPEVSYTLGLHPNHADEDAEPIWAELRRLINKNRPVAIGEIGLDYYRDYAPKATQLRVFDRQLQIAAEFGLPVVIHQREAENDVRTVLRSWPSGTSWVLHSFDGSRDFAEEAIERGAFIGVGGLMTRAGSSELRSILADIPLDRLLLETDAPYLVPRGVRNRRNESSNIPLIAAALADLRGITIDEIAATTTANANRVFDLTCKASGG